MVQLISILDFHFHFQNIFHFHSFLFYDWLTFNLATFHSLSSLVPRVLLRTKLVPEVEKEFLRVILDIETEEREPPIDLLDETMMEELKSSWKVIKAP